MRLIINFLSLFFHKIFKEGSLIHITIFLSLLALILVTVVFSWNRAFFNFENTIDEGLLGTIGDFIGGVLGSIWAFIGVILFYVALSEQRNDFKTNKHALEKQIEALSVQTEEFGLQRKELELSRNVFLEQSKTLKKQQFESTFFAMIQMYSDNIKSLNLLDPEGEDYFVQLTNNLESKNKVTNNPIESHSEALLAYNRLFYEKKKEISHYFRIVYRILRFIDSSQMTDDDKVMYAKILRSQFSENELLILYYNSHIVFGKKLIPLVLKYNIFKHLPHDSKIEFKDFKTENIRIGFNKLVFSQDLIEFLKDFLSVEYNYSIDESDFEISRSFKIENVGIVHLFCSDPDLCELTLSFLEIDLDSIEAYLGLDISQAFNYFNNQIHHVFILSTYIEYQNLDFEISGEINDNNIVFKISSKKSISL